MGCSGSKQPAPGEVPAKKGWELTDEVISQGYDPEKAPHYVSDVHEVREIRFAQRGPASEAECPAWTLSHMFKLAADNKKDKLAFAVEWPIPELNADGTAPEAKPLQEWKRWTWGEYYEESLAMAKALIAVGAAPFSGSVIYGFNSPFWVMAQMSSVLATVLPAGIYPTDTQQQLEYKARYANAAAIFCGDAKQYEAIRAVVGHLPELKLIVTWNHLAPNKTLQREGDLGDVKVMHWDEAVALGRIQPNTEVEQRLQAQDPRGCAALVFTSGTTGMPKAVMLSHDNICFQARATIGTLAGFCADATKPERGLSYLPMSHVASQIVDIVSPCAATATRPSHVEIYFVRPYDLKAGTLGDRLRLVRPTSFLGVPRVWEKIAAKIQAKGAETKGLKKKVAAFAKRKGLAFEIDRQVGRQGKVPAYYGFARKKVLMKVREALGLEECRFAITGAAAIAKDLQEYFASLGIPILDAYGSSECGGACTSNSDTAHLFGSVGQCMPGMECRVFRVAENGDINNKVEAPKTRDLFNPALPEEEQGELCFRGRHVMLGYYANPALGEEHVEEIQTKNAETIDREGFLHTGDKGACSVLNMFAVTGRYKELIVGAGGENIAPVPIEDALKKRAPGISNAIMIGDKRKFNVMLVTLKAVGATGELPGTDELDPDAVRAVGTDKARTIAQAAKDPTWIAHVQEALEAVNNDGNVVVSNAAKVQRFTILPHDLSVVGGELTPTLKSKRAFIDDKYKAIIDAVYAADTKNMYVECPTAQQPGTKQAEPVVAANQQPAVAAKTAPPAQGDENPAGVQAAAAVAATQ